MSYKTLNAAGLAVLLLFLTACAPVQATPEGPPPPQNLLGSTDQLQLITELSIGLADKYGGDHVLVVFEIDNTLLVMERDADCDSAAMRPTQADAAQQIRRMQEKGLKVMVLTSRESGCLNQTLQELNRNGFGFEASAWPPQNGYSEAFIPDGAVRPVTYQDGVFFAAGQDKGLMLKTLLEKSGEPYPTLILISDQRQQNLNAVMKAFSFTPTRVHAWRYTREDTVEATPDH